MAKCADAVLVWRDRVSLVCCSLVTLDVLSIEVR
jgi:hypothetical protein